VEPDSLQAAGTIDSRAIVEEFAGVVSGADGVAERDGDVGAHGVAGGVAGPISISFFGRNFENSSLNAALLAFRINGCYH
jgi:hypothetical protein